MIVYAMSIDTVLSHLGLKSFIITYFNVTTNLQ